MNPAEIERLLDAWRDGSLDETEARALAAAIETDAEIRKQIASHLRFDAALGQVAQAFDVERFVRGVDAALDAKKDEDRFLAVYQKRQEAVEREAVRQRLVDGARRRRARVIGASAFGLAAAAALVLWFGRAEYAGAPIARLERTGAEIAPAGQDRPRPVAPGTPVRAGDALATAAEGTTLAYPDGTQISVGDATRVRVETGASGGKLLVLQSGWLATDLEAPRQGASLRVATPHAAIETSDADFKVTVAARTELKVWAGEVFVADLSSHQRVSIRQGQWATVEPGGRAQVLWQRGWAGTNAVGETNPHPPGDGEVAAQARALLADSSKPAASIAADSAAAATDGPQIRTGKLRDLRNQLTTDADTLYTGRGHKLDWGGRFLSVGASRWDIGPGGIRQPIANEGQGWDFPRAYRNGILNMLQVYLTEPRSFRARLRIHLDEAPASSDWSLGLVAFFKADSLLTCHYVRGPNRSRYTLEAHNHARQPDWAVGPYPSRLAPMTAAESYWVELQIVRRASGEDSDLARCQIWADGDSARPDGFIEGRVALEGDLARIGLRTYRAAATFDSVEVVPLPE